MVANKRLALALFIASAVACAGSVAIFVRILGRGGASSGSQSLPPAPHVVFVPGGPPMRIDPAEAARAGVERGDNALGMKFCWCPPGTFHMGNVSGIGPKAPETTPVRVTLSRGFWMGKYEVTQEEWRRLMGATLREQRAKDPTQPRPVGDGSTRDHVGEGPDYPIYFVNHTEAEEFCRKLTQQERQAGRIGSRDEYRLPTEAEWEFACRAGTTTATPFGDRLGAILVNFDGTYPFKDAPVGPYLRETTPVGRYPANPWGLHDMLGNVWEWCRDGYATALPGGDDPLGLPSAQRSYRGGCWHDRGFRCLSATRGRGAPENRGSGLGFRAALIAPGP